ncbi:hypothetical protein ACIRG5_30825 [Lentzea sp. NPDC102401]|uniref:hypothetical protein n=1 Tax=Lentzea sp. NPDC102401 TaxID=3364128 RepID=UPI00382966F9
MRSLASESTTSRFHHLAVGDETDGRRGFVGGETFTCCATRAVGPVGVCPVQKMFGFDETSVTGSSRFHGSSFCASLASAARA